MLRGSGARGDVAHLPITVFVTVLGAAVCATILAREAVPALQGRSQIVVQAERPPDGDHYLANGIGGHVDHHVHFFGTDAEVLRRMRAADVLFLGNSRLMFALRPSVLRPFFEAEGVPYYVMGFGFREADRFPLAIIRKFDLRPRLVVVNADGFFGGGLSAWAEVVNRDTPYGARKLQWEAEAAHEARRVLHRVVPNWLRLLGEPEEGLTREFIAYRARFDGTWEVSPWGEVPDVFRDPPPDGRLAGRGEIAAARAFKEELDRRGSQLVLTRVPAPVPMPGAGPARFAELLGVPLLTVKITAQTSRDGGHLSEASAHDWSRELLRVLAPFVRATTATDR